MKKKGFTLIELVMIIVILGVLAAVAIPRFYNLSTQARVAAERGVVGGVRSGISTYFANACAAGNCDWPDSLDNADVAACTSNNTCFGTVLAQPITDDWTKATTNTYTGPNNTTYTYNSATGTFQ